MNSCLLLTISMVLFGLLRASPQRYEDTLNDRVQRMSVNTARILANSNETCPNGKVPAAAVICSSADTPPCHVPISCVTILKPKYVNFESKVPRRCYGGKLAVWDDSFCHVNGYTVQCRRYLQCMWTKNGLIDQGRTDYQFIEYVYPELHPTNMKCDRKTEHVVWSEANSEICKYQDQDVICDYMYKCANNYRNVSGVNGCNSDESKP